MRLNKADLALLAITVAAVCSGKASWAQGQGSSAQGAPPQSASSKAASPAHQTPIPPQSQISPLAAPAVQAAMVSGTAAPGASKKAKSQVVPEGEARMAALKAVAGIVKKSKLEKEHGQSVYEFKIKAESDGAVKKIRVNAKTGALIDVKKAD